MAFGIGDIPERAEPPCTHPNRLLLELDHPAIREILEQHAELFEGMTPDHAYVCLDCHRLWLAFPLTP